MLIESVVGLSSDQRGVYSAVARIAASVSDINTVPAVPAPETRSAE